MSNQTKTRRRRRKRTRLGVLIGVGAVVALILLAILIDSAVYYNKVHTGVSVSGQGLGGLTRDEAAATLTMMVEKAQKNPIVLKSGGKTWKVMPSDVGTEIDVQSAVNTAMDVSRKSNFVADLFRRLKLYFSDTDIPLHGTVDSAKMDEVLGEVAKELDLPAVNAGLTIDGKEIKVVEGQKGTVVDVDSLRESLKSLLFTLHATELQVPMIVKEPTVLAQDNEAALQQAQTMISGSLKLTSGEKTWTFSPEDIVAYMDFKAEDKNGVSTLVPFLSAEKMDPFFKNIAGEIATKPVNAKFDSDGSKAWVVEGKNGTALDKQKTADALTAAALETAGRTAEAAVVTQEPELTTEEAEAMGIKNKLGPGFTTEYEGTADRQINVKITTKYASNVILAPGDVYNFDEQIGPRTAERGYRKAPGIVGPGKLEDVFGGGICQVSTTLFNAVFFAGLEVVERKNHSIYIDHYPKGRDATVSAGSPNLRFKNDTDHYIWIRGASDGITTTFNIYGTSDGRKVSFKTGNFVNWVEQSSVTVTNKSLAPGKTVIQQAGQRGRDITVKRTVTWPDGHKHTDTFESHYPMIPKTIEVGTGTTTTTKPPSTTTTTTEPVPTSTTGSTSF